MKKRIAGVLLSVLLIVAALGVPAYAADFELTDSNPADGYEKVEAKNVMVKLFFSEDISSDASQKANADKITFKTSKGKDVDFQIVYDDKDSKKICLLAENDLSQNAKYVVTVSEDLVSDSGETLGKETKVNFSTRKSDGSFGYMILMLLMIVVMVVTSVRDTKKKAEGADENGASINTNPYKLAKEKGISVQEAAKLIEKERAKQVKKAERAAAALKADEEEEEEPERADVYKVKTKRIASRKVKHTPHKNQK